MKKTVVFIFALVITSILCGCKTSGKNVLKKRIERMESSSNNPVSIEEIEAAIKEYSKDADDVAKKNAQVGMWHKILGLKYLDKKMYGKAMECFQTALEYYPDNANLYYYVGNCAGYLGNSALDYEGTGSYEKMENYYSLSEKAYLRALAIDDGYAYALYGIGVLYVYQLGQPEDAIPHLEKLLTIDTKNVDGMFVLANAYYLTKNYDKSAEMFDKISATTKSDKTKQAAEENKKKVIDEAYSN